MFLMLEFHILEAFSNFYKLGSVNKIYLAMLKIHFLFSLSS